jgi:hypothetical protein
MSESRSMRSDSKHEQQRRRNVVHALEVTQMRMVA